MFLFIVNVGFEPVQMRRRRLALRSRTSLPTMLTKLPPTKEAQIFYELCISPRLW